MRVYWILLGCLVFSWVSAWGAERALPEQVVERLREAETAYREGRYRDALEGYRHLQSEGLTGWLLDYNAGNASFRSGELGWAIYFYEKALRANPRDPDVRHNYEQAREALGLSAGVGDESRSAVLMWAARLSSSFSRRDALRWLIVLGWAASILGAMGLVWPRWRRPVASSLRVVGVVALVVALGFGFKVWQGGHQPNGVLTSSAEVLSAPQGDAQELTRLSAGTLLRQGRRLGEWVEVQVGEDVRGWVEREALQSL